MTNLFSQVPNVHIPRSQFDRSFGHKTTFDAGYLVPIFLDEVLPGDSFKCIASVFARLATPVAPIMDNMYMDVHFWFCPNRLVWNNWEKLNGQQDNPGDSTDYLTPIMTVPTAGYEIGSLYDYMGLPMLVDGNDGAATTYWTHISLPMRMYNKIWNDWYRSQDIQDSVVVDMGDGPDDPADYVLLRSNKRHDYFTSALPRPQKGDAVTIPLAEDTTLVERISSAANPWIPKVAGTNTNAANNTVNSNGAGAVTVNGVGVNFDPAQTLQVDLTDNMGTINALRQAVQIQRLYEKDARGGTRYTEVIRAHFGVVSPDARLQRPEFLGGFTTPVNFHPIPQTSSTDAETPQGNTAAMATVSGGGRGFTKAFTEHGWIIGLARVRADLTYQRCLNRMWSRRTRWDYYWPTLAHIGEQGILRQEIHTGEDAGLNAEIFGYQERYAEYRYKPAQITGKFRSYASGTLDFWHLAQNFTGYPLLNQAFIEENPPVDRIIATPSEPHFLFDSYFKLICARPMPVYGVPGLMDHF